MHVRMYVCHPVSTQADDLNDATHIFIKSSVAKSAFCPLEIGYRFSDKRDLVKVTQISYLKKAFHVLYADQLGRDTENKLQHRLKKYR